MQTQVIAHQLDFFGAPIPIQANVSTSEPLPHPSLWSDSVKEKMVDALIEFACDSRRGDTMPESLMDCAELLSLRLKGSPFDKHDYAATIGWIMGYWDGAVPYKFVCLRNGIDPEILQDVLYGNALLRTDVETVRSSCFGSLL